MRGDTGFGDCDGLPRNGEIMRDAIVYSGWTWETFNVPERIALALNYLGARVLYCGSPVSVFRKPKSDLREVEPGIFAFRPAFLAERLNRLAFLQNMQARFVAKQILEKAVSLQLRDPIFYYVCLGIGFPFCRIFAVSSF